MTTNVQAVFQRHDISSCRMRATQQVRTLITDYGNPTANASKLIKDILDVEVKFDDATKARIATQYIVDLILVNNFAINDVDQLVAAGIAKANEFIHNPNNSWMLAKPEQQGVSAPAATVSEDGEVTLTNKKGAKRDAAFELYRQTVLAAETPLNCQQFVALLKEKIGMTPAGAATYASLCVKTLGASKGVWTTRKQGAVK